MSIETHTAAEPPLPSSTQWQSARDLAAALHQLDEQAPHYGTAEVSLSLTMKSSGMRVDSIDLSPALLGLIASVVRTAAEVSEAGSRLPALRPSGGMPMTDVAELCEALTDHSLPPKQNKKLRRHLRPAIADTRQAIISRDGGARCAYCGRLLPSRPGSDGRGQRTVDHVIPFALVRHWELWNLVLACEPCNHAKGAAIPSFLLPLLAALVMEHVRRQKAPVERSLVPVRTAHNVPAAWTVPGCAPRDGQ